MEQDAKVHYLQQHLHGEHSRERVVEVVQDLVPVGEEGDVEGEIVLNGMDFGNDYWQ